MITLYHGDNYATDRLDPSLMLNGNAQEGVGIYFSKDIEVASTYGKNIIAVEVDESGFFLARETMASSNEEDGQVPLSRIYSLFDRLYEEDKEKVEDLLYDYGKEFISKKNIDSVAKLMAETEARNFQIELAQLFGESLLVKVWNEEFSEKIGMYNPDTGFYAISDPEVEVRPVIKSTLSSIKSKKEDFLAPTPPGM